MDCVVCGQFLEFGCTCPECHETALILSQMSDCSAQSSKATRQRGGVGIEKMVMRITSHDDYKRLPMRTQRQFTQRTRFDRRRNKADNDFIRAVYRKMNDINVFS